MAVGNRETAAAAVTLDTECSSTVINPAQVTSFRSADTVLLLSNVSGEGRLGEVSWGHLVTMVVGNRETAAAVTLDTECSSTAINPAQVTSFRSADTVLLLSNMSGEGRLGEVSWGHLVTMVVSNR